MGLEHLLEALERDAGTQVEQLLAQARAEAERLTVTAAEDRERRRSNALGEHERLQREAVARALTTVRRTARRAELEARHRLLERVFVAMHALLPEAAGGPAFRTTLPHALAAALAGVGDEPAIIRCPKPLAEELRRLAPPGRASVVVDDAVGSGFRITTEDGVIEVDETLEARFERQRPALARLALQHLGLEP